MLNAFDVLMGAQKKRKKGAPAEKGSVKHEAKEPTHTQEDLQGRKNAFDLLRAPQPPTKKSRKKGENVKSEEEVEEEFTLNFDSKAGLWTWTWVTVPPHESLPSSSPSTPTPTSAETSDSSYPAPQLPPPLDQSTVKNTTLQTFFSELQPPSLPHTGKGPTTAKPIVTAATTVPTTPRVIVVRQEPDVVYDSAVNVKLAGVQNSRIKLHSVYKQAKLEWPKKTGKAYYLAPSLLKSMLQKNIRRCRPEAALRIAAELIRCDWLQFIRRLPVIMLEDSFLHPLLPAVVWLMLASSSSSSQTSFVPGRDHVDLCLQVVWDIAQAKYRDAPFVFAPIFKAPAHEAVARLLPFQQAFVKAAMVRAAYGGMKCDVAMLCAHAGVWTKRFLSDPQGWASVLDTVYPSSEGRNSAGLAGMRVTVSHREIGQIRPEDIILAGVDFHCTPILDYVMTDPQVLSAIRDDSDDGGNIEGNVRQAMWTFRSGVSYKMPIEPESEIERKGRCKKEDDEKKLGKLWDAIEGVCDEWSFQFITKKKL